MHYIELTCSLNTMSQEILSAYLITGLGEIGYESFEERENIVVAYIPEEMYNQILLQERINEIPEEFGKISWEVSKIEQQNWNAEWEKHFNPVLISDKVLIKASFHHNLPEAEFPITINPKMSFGTGHHSTTALMIKSMLEIDFKDKTVLDMGCGTGILAILANKLGAATITAVDIDEWAVSNAKENFQLNNIADCELLQGGAELISGKKFDIILANINRNILINDMHAYAASLKTGGILLISGVYNTNLEQIQQAAEKSGLTYKSYIEKNNWIAALFVS